MAIQQYPAYNNVVNALTWKYQAVGGETTVSGKDNFNQVLLYTAGIEQVYLNGVLLVRAVDYTAVDGKTVTFPIHLNTNDYLQIYCITAYSVATTSGSGESFHPFLMMGA